MFNKILVPLDGSQLAAKVLPHAQELAKQSGAELLLVRVLRPMPVTPDYNKQPSPTTEVAQQAEAEAYLQEVAKELHRLKLKARTLILERNRVAEAIIDLACQEAVDLIVMSTHGRSGLSRWVYGSVANKILQGAPGPIFLYRAGEAEC